MEQSVFLTRRGAERLKLGHPWIYRGDVERSPSTLAGGEVVVMKDGRSHFLGKAFWSARSKIALRTVSREDVPVDEELFRERIASALALRAQAFPGEPSARIVHGESDLLPGLIVDRYGDVAVMQTLIPATDQRKALLADLLRQALPLRSVVERNDVRVREARGSPAGEGGLVGRGARRSHVP